MNPPTVYENATPKSQNTESRTASDISIVYEMSRLIIPRPLYISIDAGFTVDLT